MAAAYLEWLKEVFDEAQVPLTEETADYLDTSIRKICNLPSASEEQLFTYIRNRWLRAGPPGRQLLAAFIRDEVFSRRDSPFRPTEGMGFYTNDYQAPALPEFLSTEAVRASRGIRG